MTSFLYKWGPVIAVMSFIFWLSSVPGPAINAAGFGNEGLHINGHFFVYMLLGLTLYRALKKYWLALIISFLFALSDEYHQSFVIGRTSGWFDIWTDLAGTSLGLFLIWILDLYLPNKLKNSLRKLLLK